MACIALRVASHKTVTEFEATDDHARLLVCGIAANPFGCKAQSGEDLDFERQSRSLYVPRGGYCRSRTGNNRCRAISSQKVLKLEA